MFGNSGVAMPQWRIAAEQPPHLACIAPWEGTGDLYRESIFEGGIPGCFCEGIRSSAWSGLGYMDDTMAMAEKYPFMNAYWEDKIPQVGEYQDPVLHHGLLEPFPPAWLHGRLQEDPFPQEVAPGAPGVRMARHVFRNVGLEDLKRFFDRYLKDIRNGWELTPRVRLEVMDAYEYDYRDQPPGKGVPPCPDPVQETLPRCRQRARFLRPGLRMNRKSVTKADGRQAQLCIKFKEDTEIPGT